MPHGQLDKGPVGSTSSHSLLEAATTRTVPYEYGDPGSQGSGDEDNSYLLNAPTNASPAELSPLPPSPHFPPPREVEDQIKLEEDEELMASLPSPSDSESEENFSDHDDDEYIPGQDVLVSYEETEVAAVPAKNSRILFTIPQHHEVAHEYSQEFQLQQPAVHDDFPNEASPGSPESNPSEASSQHVRISLIRILLPRLTIHRQTMNKLCFIGKLHCMLSNPSEYGDVLRWDETGSVVMIGCAKKERLEDVLWEQFRHRTFSAFGRQFAVYGFAALTRKELVKFSPSGGEGIRFNSSHSSTRAWKPKAATCNFSSGTSLRDALRIKAIPSSARRLAAEKREADRRKGWKKAGYQLSQDS
ncbi:hypothetical protein P7C70_g7677, partial [Phenoliferia sp. Uapishka_3]